MKLLKDYTGQTVGNRTVLSFVKFTKHKDPLWLVECICGHKFESLTQDLKRPTCRNCTMRQLRKRPFESLYNAFVHKASKRHEVQISYEEFLKFTEVNFCHYCDSPILWIQFLANSRKQRYAYHLDRKDSAGPYSVDNVVVCCTRCNYGKGNGFTYNEWVQIGRLIKSWSVK